MVAVDVNAMFIGGSIFVTCIAIYFLWLSHDKKKESRRTAAGRQY